jgi:hypothetical protein
MRRAEFTGSDPYKVSYEKLTVGYIPFQCCSSFFASLAVICINDASPGKSEEAL